MMIRIGQRMADFVGTNGAKVLRAAEHAAEQFVPGLDPPKRRVVTPRRAVVAAGVAVAGLAASAMTPGTKSPNRSAKEAVVDLAEKTREELYEMAKKVDLEGRSSMSKDELAQALSKGRG